MKFVKITKPGRIEVYDAADVKRTGIEYACPVWTCCTTKKHMADMIDSYTDCESNYSDARRCYIHTKRELIDDCTLWIGTDCNNGEFYETGDALPKNKTSRFECAYLMTAYDCATYGDNFILTYDVNSEVTYVRDRSENYDNEIPVELADICEYTKEVQQAEQKARESFSEWAQEAQSVLDAGDSIRWDALTGRQKNYLTNAYGVSLSRYYNDGSIWAGLI